MPSIEGLKRLNQFMPPPIPRETLLMHPNIFQRLAIEIGGELDPDCGRHLTGKLSGMEVVCNTDIPPYAKKWEYPTRDGFAYDNNDEFWCRYFGFGQEVDDLDRPIVYKMSDGNPSLGLGAPTMLDSLKYMEPMNHRQ